MSRRPRFPTAASGRAPTPVVAVVATAFVLVMTACASSPTAPTSAVSTTAVPTSGIPTPTVPPPTLPPVTGLPPDAVVDYQLGGDYEPAPEVTVVTRDSTSLPAQGRYSICYLNGFQTQPGDDWPADLLVTGPDGKPLVDPNWPDETILDISTADRRARILDRHGAAIDGCAARGFDAVEFDNLDSYTRSGGRFGEQDALELAGGLVARAHGKGLAAGQKNASELASIGHSQVGFEFAVAEECDQFTECAAYTAVYGDQVIDIEYTDALRRPFAQLCADPETPAATVLRDRDLSPAGTPGHVFETC